MTRTFNPSYGIGYSNSGIVKEDGSRTKVLGINRKQIEAAGGCEGLASVHVAVKDEGLPLGPVGRKNAMLQLDVSWQAGLGGGDAIVDATQGSLFTVGATQALTIHAFFTPAVEGELLFPYIRKYVEVTVHWKGSPNPKAAYSSLPGITLVQNVESAFKRIPQQARSMTAWADIDARLVSTTAEFANAPDAGSILIRTTNPNANGTPIGHGNEFVRFITTAVGFIIFPKFELWL